MGLHVTVAWGHLQEGKHVIIPTGSLWNFSRLEKFVGQGSGYGKENDKVYSDAPLGGTLADMW